MFNTIFGNGYKKNELHRQKSIAGKDAMLAQLQTNMEIQQKMAELDVMLVPDYTARAVGMTQAPQVSGWATPLLELERNSALMRAGIGQPAMGGPPRKAVPRIEVPRARVPLLSELKDAAESNQEESRLLHWLK